MSNSINILTWNVRGVISSSLCLSELLVKSKCDIAIITEHKLKSSCDNYLDSICSDYCSLTRIEKSTNETLSDICRFLGKGGVSIMYKKGIQFSVVEITDISSTRIIGVELKRYNRKSLFIFSVHLPSDSNTQSYVDEINLLEALYNLYSSYGDVLIGGDFNASLYTKDYSHCNLQKSKIMKDLITRNNLACPNIDFKTSGSNYTFNTTRTTLDYIICSKTLSNYVVIYHVYEEGSFSSTSDHLPICMELQTDIKTHVLSKPSASLPAWHKAKPDQIKEYEKYIRNHANFQNISLKTIDDLDKFCTELNSVLHSASSLTIPTAKYKPFLRPEWTPKVKELHDTERQMRRMWINEGRPRGMTHDSYKKYKHAKRNFRNELNDEHDRYMSSVFKDIDESSECDVRLFWKLIRRLKPRSSRTYPVIEYNDEQFDDPPGVSLAFAKHFSDIYNAKENANYCSDFLASIENRYSELVRISRSTNDSFPGGPATVKEIQNIIRNLKRRKAPGLDLTQNEHLIHGGIQVARCIALNSSMQFWKSDMFHPVGKKT
ncbi:uncharacterized protein LOC134238510 [Saccostrea cucullata]|uniref:uncharacterized protein LOC134238510 n=1 Tax=Saccostrea cuccullata TaxID=36930 RepID=UPI002ED2A6ED